jgi:hypothetical protein
MTTEKENGTPKGTATKNKVTMEEEQEEKGKQEDKRNV